MDADDISLPYRLQTQYDFMIMNPEVSVSGSSVELIKPDGSHSSILTYPTHDSMIKFNMLFYCCFAHPTIIMRKDFAQRITYEMHGKLEDYRLWLSFLHDASVKYANLGEVLLKLRKHDKNVSMVKSDHIKEEV
jgi:hypothetical protein